MASKRSKKKAADLARSADFQGFLAEFQDESDRAMAVLGGAFIETHLERLIRAFLVDDREIEPLFEPEGAVGSFGTKIRLAYCHLGGALERCRCRPSGICREGESSAG